MHETETGIGGGLAIYSLSTAGTQNHLRVLRPMSTDFQHSTVSGPGMIYMNLRFVMPYNTHQVAATFTDYKNICNM